MTLESVSVFIVETGIEHEHHQVVNVFSSLASAKECARSAMAEHYLSRIDPSAKWERAVRTPDCQSWVSGDGYVNITRWEVQT